AAFPRLVRFGADVLNALHHGGLRFDLILTLNAAAQHFSEYIQPYLQRSATTHLLHLADIDSLSRYDLNDKHIMIVDDVITHGITIRKVIKDLRNRGATTAAVFAIVRAELDSTQSDSRTICAETPEETPAYVLTSVPINNDPAHMDGQSGSLED